MTIDRRSGLSYEQFEREYLIPRRPVILTDALDQCPARTRWTPEYFKRVVGHRTVATDSGAMKMSDVMDGIERSRVAGKVPFLRERPVPWILPELLPDMDPYPVYARPNWFEYPFARWADLTGRGFGAMLLRLAQTDINVTGPGVNFPYLHLDRFRCHALIMQWYGNKEFFVFDPAQTPYLYPNEDGDLAGVNDVLNPDLVRFPLFAQAKMHRATLNAGEALFNPSGWWHTTRTLDPSIATVISFANRSNWTLIVRRMMPRGLKSKLAFAPFALYLLALGWLRLPGYRFRSAARLDSSLLAFEHFQRIAGKSFPVSWENASAMVDASVPSTAAAPAAKSVA